MRSIAQKRLTAVGARASEQVAVLQELGGQLLGARRLAAAHTEREAVGRRHADGRRASNHHGLDGPGDLGRVSAGEVGLSGRQLALVHHDHRVVLPGNRRKHRSDDSGPGRMGSGHSEAERESSRTGMTGSIRGASLEQAAPARSSFCPVTVCPYSRGIVRRTGAAGVRAGRRTTFTSWAWRARPGCRRRTPRGSGGRRRRAAWARRCRPRRPRR